MEKSFAFFDFDGTLSRGDSFVAFVLYAAKHGACGIGCLLSGLGAGIAYKLGLMAEKPAKEKALAFVKGKSEGEITSLAQGFCRDVLSKRLYRDGIREIRRLKESGVPVWVVSASPAFYLKEIRCFLPVDRIIATRFETDENGCYTGRVFGENCKGAQKPLRLAEVLASRGELVDYENSHAYGDSAGDIPMLNLCANRHCINAKRKLRRRMAGQAEMIRWK